MVSELTSRLRHSAWMPCVVLALFVVQIGIWAFDRAPPFRLINKNSIEAIGHPGEMVNISAEVDRDTGRGCSVSFSRYVYSANGTRYDLEGLQRITAVGLKKLEARSPNHLLLAVDLPTTFPIGKAALAVNLEYVCNPLHHIWPISVYIELPFEVMPAGPKT